ncbi:unnamed protein product, partial [Rhizophagus irregularis]
MTSVKEWIEKKIKNEYIRYFEYDKFSQITEIDRGGFGQVSKANLANAGLVALKIFFSNNSNIEEDELNEANDGFIKELKLLREVDYHQNINRILGITKDSKHYILYNEDKNNSKTDDDDLIIPSNYQIINSRNENGKPSQLKIGSFDLQSPPHLNIPNNDDSKDDLTLHSD